MLSYPSWEVLKDYKSGLPTPYKEHLPISSTNINKANLRTKSHKSKLWIVKNGSMPKNLKITRSITSCIQPLKDASICLIAAQNGPTSLHIHWHFDPLWAKPNHVKLIAFLARLRWGSKFCATFPSVKKKTWGCLCNFRLVSKKTFATVSW